MGAWLITLTLAAAGVDPGTPTPLTPIERVEVALRCKPGAEVCAHGGSPATGAENAFPSSVVLRVDEEEGGGLDALVLRRSIIPGERRTLLFRYSISGDGSIASASCIWDLPREGSSLGSVRAPNSFFEESGLIHHSNGCRYQKGKEHKWGATFRLDGTVLKETATPPLRISGATDCFFPIPEAVGTRFSKAPMSEVYRRRALPLPPGNLRTSSLQGHGYLIPADEPGRIWIVDEDRSIDRERERLERFTRATGHVLPAPEETTLPGTRATDESTPILDLATGALPPGALLVGPGSELIVEADGIPLLIASHESGLQLDLLIDPALAKGWREARARLPAKLEGAIWAPPLLLAADRLFRITPAGAELLCASMETTDASVGLLPFGSELPSTSYGSEPDPPGWPRAAGPAYGGGSLYMPWDGGIKVGRCVSTGPTARDTH